MSTSTTPAPAAPSWRERVVGNAAFRLESLLVLAVLTAVMAVLSNVFFSVSNFLNILLSTSVFGVLAIGMTFVICSPPASICRSARFSRCRASSAPC